MANIELKYGKSHYYFEFDDTRFDVLAAASESAPLSDLQLNEKLDQPIGTPVIEEIVQPGETVLIVVPDATREVACGQVVNVLVRRLIANGTSPSDISIIFSTGIHRPVTEDEKTAILTPFIAQRIKTLDHTPRDISRIVRLGETSGGIAVELNRALVENDRIILIGGISFHYFAGFTGGRKLICPGLASSKTISATHKLAFDCETRSRRDGVGTGLLDENAVHEAFVEAASKTKPSFCISTFVDEAGEAVDLYCGDWIESHQKACGIYADRYTLELTEKREIVIASCGGFPHDVNLIQAHKTLEAASKACIDGGTIILLAECRDGLGREDFLKWFEAANSRQLADRLCDAYQVNGQTAWNLFTIAEKFDVRIVSDLPEAKVKPTRMRHFASLAEALKGVESLSGYIVPAGSKIRFVSTG
ncbi:MAG: nickel-dependent lactate racemase [Acidobacteria bacterium]|nr:nickel-dependent lactate racemase [Acidobacteriota bacterium]